MFSACVFMCVYIFIGARVLKARHVSISMQGQPTLLEGYANLSTPSLPTETELKIRARCIRNGGSLGLE